MAWNNQALITTWYWPTMATKVPRKVHSKPLRIQHTKKDANFQEGVISLPGFLLVGGLLQIVRGVCLSRLVKFSLWGGERGECRVIWWWGVQRFLGQFLLWLRLGWVEGW